MPEKGGSDLFGFGAQKEIKALKKEIEALKSALGHARKIEAVLEALCALGHVNTERFQQTMATLQDLKDALAEQNQAILDELVEINNAITTASGVPQDVVDSVKANTQAVRDIIADPLPVPDPLPPTHKR